MDEREERVVKTRSTAGTQQNKTRRRPRRIAGEPEDTRMDSNRIDHSGCWGPDFLEAIWLIE